MEWATMPIRRYADFSGRSRRKEYWMYVLLMIAIYAVLGVLMFAGGLGPVDPMTGQAQPGPLFWVVIILYLVVAFGLFVPSLAVIIRRLHDQDKSGWMFLLGFVPFVGGIILLVFMCLEGTNGPNRYGPDPKAGEPGHAPV